MLFIILFLLLKISLKHAALAKDDQVKFVKQFIVNEQKPTHLILYSQCWNKEYQVYLVKELSVLGINIATSTKCISKYTEQGLLILADLNCPNTVEALNNATMNNLIRAPYRWLVISEKENDLNNVIQNLPLLPDSDWVFAEKGEKGFIMTEMHKVSSNNALQFNTRGYTNGTLVDVRSERSLFQRRKNLHKHAIVMANMIQDSNSSIHHLDDRLEPEYDLVTKVSWWIVKMVAEMLNAEVTYKLAWRWGYKQNGTWDGMMKMIHSKEADLGTNCMVASSRLEVITYGDMLVPFRVRFIFRQPPLSYVSNIFYLPFTGRVWLALVVCTITSFFTLYCTSKVEARTQSSPTQLDGSMNDALLVTMSAISQQGSLLEPKKASGRITILVKFITLMALYAAYSANIVVLLRAPSNSIKTLSQLADSIMTLAAHKLDYNYYVLRFYNDSLHESIYRRINPEQGKAQYYTIDEGVKKIREGIFAFHALVDLVYRKVEATYLEKEKCDLMEVDFFNGLHPAVPIQKHSPYLELFRVQFKRIREAGIQSALNKRVQVPKPTCTDKTAFNSVGLIDIRGVIFMLLYGISLSILIVLLEIIIHKRS